MKKILKRLGIGVGILLVLLLLLSGAVYAAYPSVEVEVSHEASVSPEAAFDAFLKFEHWHDYWDIYELYPPEDEIGVGTRFAYDASEGYVELEILEYVYGEVIRFDMLTDGLHADFTLRFEPTPNGTRLTASNQFEVDGLMRVMLVGYVKSGMVDGYYGSMMENVERVAQSTQE